VNVSRDPADIAEARAQILAGGRRRTRRHVPVVIVEHHPTCQTKRDHATAIRVYASTCVCPKSWPIFLDLRDQCRAHRLPAPFPEFRFSPVRRWRFDAAWSLAPIRPIKLALEIDGGIFLAGGGRHNRGAGYRADQEKLNEAAVLGWSILRCLPEDIRHGRALTWVSRYFAAHGLSPSPMHPFTEAMKSGVPI
jgi:hypothetical protein